MAQIMVKVVHLTKIMDKIILKAKAVLADRVVNRWARTAQVMAKAVLAVKMAHKETSKVAQMGKIMAMAAHLEPNKAASKADQTIPVITKAVLPGITVLHQTFKTVAGTAVHPTKVVNANRIKMNLIIKRI